MQDVSILCLFRNFMKENLVMKIWLTFTSQRNLNSEFELCHCMEDKQCML